ncbi:MULTISPECIES: ABC transporter permease [unclassified Yimella]|uniref:ABC transporter permease n=1 Tax=unclassified Yimella TaxID=2649892 RepID=UPI00101C619E|nr:MULTISPECIES: ABC transporter permease [unclassified Yimella]MCG8656669.1 ABC transporter permease [Yimella sp. NH-Cas1]RYG78658.1 ABC transporter permease [Yimella sp. RIT 621]
MNLPLRLARRFSRAAFIRWVPTIVAAAMVFIVTITLVVQALTLTGEQRTQRDHGRMGWRTDLSQIEQKGHLPRQFASMAAALRHNGVSDYDIEWATFDIKPSGAPTEFTEFLERDWRSNPLPGRFVLTSGRMPQAPGEVVVTHATSGHVANGTLSVLSGTARLSVVGIVDDRYTRKSQILAAPGTAARFSDATLAAFPTLSGLTAVYWDGDSIDRVTSALAPIVARVTGQQRPAVVRNLSAATTSRAESVARPAPTFTHRFPLIGWVLVAGLPLVAGIAAAGSARRHLHRRTLTLRSVGVDRRTAITGLGVALTLSTLLWVTVGTIIGVALAALLRVVIAQTWAYQPLAPLRLPTGSVLVAASCAVAGVVMTALPGLGATPARRASSAGASWLTFLRRVTAAAGCAAVIALAVSTNTTKESMILVGACLGVAVLVMPDLVPLILRRVPEGAPSQRLAVRQLRADSSRAQAAILTLVVAVAVPVAFFTLVSTVTHAGNDARVATVPRGQIMVSDGQSGIGAPSTDVVNVVRANLPAARTVVLGAASGAAGPVAIENAPAMGVWTVNGPADAERLIGSPLTEAQRVTLDRGGILVWDDKPAGTRRLTSWAQTTSGPDGAHVAAVVDATPAVIDPSWQRNASGLITRAGLERHGLRSDGGLVVFTGVSDGDAQAVARDVVARGIDISQVVVHEEPNSVVVPLAFTLAAIMLAAVVGFTALVLFRGQARTMSRYLASLVAIGLTPVWVGRVLLRQAVIICVVGTLIGAAIGVASVIAFSRAHQGLPLVVPWVPIIATTGLGVSAALLSSVLSGRRVRATDRFTD